MVRKYYVCWRFLGKISFLYLMFRVDVPEDPKTNKTCKNLLQEKYSSLFNKLIIKNALLYKNVYLTFILYHKLCFKYCNKIKELEAF